MKAANNGWKGSIHKVKFDQLLNEIKARLLVVFCLLAELNSRDAVFSPTSDQLKSTVYHRAELSGLPADQTNFVVLRMFTYSNVGSCDCSEGGFGVNCYAQIVAIFALQVLQVPMSSILDELQGGRYTLGNLLAFCCSLAFSTSLGGDVYFRHRTRRQGANPDRRLLHYE